MSILPDISMLLNRDARLSVLRRGSELSTLDSRDKKCVHNPCAPLDGAYEMGFVCKSRGEKES